MATDALSQFRHKEECPSSSLSTFIGRQGDELAWCRNCRRTVPVRKLEAQAHDDRRPRSRYSLTCVRCDHDIPLTKPKARVPLCDRCKTA